MAPSREPENKGRLEVIASETFPADDNLVSVVNFLNRSLKREGYIFGVRQANDRMTLMIYATEKAPC